MKDGGPVFPSQEIVPHEDGNERLRQHLGMTVRDYFAAAALPVCILGQFETAKIGALHGDDVVVADAYRYADAMLAEREKA